jgi:hypothetical protein
MGSVSESVSNSSFDSVKPIKKDKMVEIPVKKTMGYYSPVKMKVAPLRSSVINDI